MEGHSNPASDCTIVISDSGVLMWGRSKVVEVVNTVLLPQMWGRSKVVEVVNNVLLPQKVKGLTNIVAVACGDEHSMALNEYGQVFSWGRNSLGQLGNGSKVHSLSPQQIPNLKNIFSITCGYGHSMAITHDGELFSWGSNSCGQLGNGSYVTSVTPQQISNVTNIISISCGSLHSMVLNENGQVYSWGDNSFGQLGNRDSIRNSSTPQQISNLVDIKSISCGGSHSMALNGDSQVFSWGKNNCGQLGNGRNTNSSTPLKIENLTNIISIACGSLHSMVLNENGQVYSWGDNSFGQLGKGNRESSLIPQQIARFYFNFKNVKSIACYSFHSMAINEEDKLFAWGDNQYGQLGNRNEPTSLFPTRITISGKIWWKSGTRNLMWEFQRVIWFAHFCN